MTRPLFVCALTISLGLVFLAGCSSDNGDGDAKVIGSDDSSAESQTEDEPEAAESAVEENLESQDFAVESGFTTGTDSIGTRYTTAGARLTNPNTDLAAYDVQVLFNLLGDNGDVLDTTTERVAYVGPGEAVPVAPLQIGFDLKIEPTKLEVQVIGEFVEDAGPKGELSDEGAVLTVEGVEAVRGDYGNEFSARVTNTTDTVVEYPSWDCIFIDGKKIVGGASSTIVDPIPPGTTVQFGETFSIERLLPKSFECRVLADL